MRDREKARMLAIAIDQYHETRMDLATHPKVGDEFCDQLKRREHWEKVLRGAFHDVTGMRLVRGRGGHGWRVRD